MQDNPLEHNLGFFDFGRYHKAADGAKHAFEKVGELMGFKVDLDDKDSEDENDDDVAEKGNADIPPKSDNTAQPACSLPEEVLQIEVGKRIDTTCPPAPAALRGTLARNVAKSKDKLFLSKRLCPGHKLASLHLVQVDEEETN